MKIKLEVKLEEEEIPPPPSPAPPIPPPGSKIGMFPTPPPPRKGRNHRSIVYFPTPRFKGKNPRSTVSRRREDPLRWYRCIRRPRGAILTPYPDISPEKPDIAKAVVGGGGAPALPVHAAEPPERVDRRPSWRHLDYSQTTRRLPDYFYQPGGLPGGSSKAAPESSAGRKEAEEKDGAWEPSREIERPRGPDPGDFCPYLAMFYAALDE